MRRHQIIWLVRYPRLRRFMAAGALCLLCLTVGFSAYVNEPRQLILAEPLVSITETAPAPRQQSAPSGDTIAPLLNTEPAETQPTPLVDEFDGEGEAQADANSLRILALRDEDHPGQPAVSATEQRLVEAYARETGRSPVWKLVDETWDLLPALHAGQGDVIVGQNTELHAGMQDQALFTQPWSVSRQQIISRRDTGLPDSLADIHSGRIAVQRDSVAWPLLKNHADRHRNVNLVAVPANQSMSSMLRQLSSGHYDVAVAASNDLGDSLSRYPQLGVAFDLPGGDNRTWAVHPDATQLHESLNHYLGRDALSRSVADVRFEDLPRIAERNMLRVITYQNPANYYLDESGELRGFEYELARQFAERHDLRVDVVVAPSQQDMLRWLLEGRGDLIAASVPAAGVREDPRLSLSRPYNYAAPLIVGRKSDTGLIDARDLEGRRIVLPEGSPYKRVLERYRQRGIGVEIKEAGPGVTQAEILHRTSKGIYDLTVIGSHKVRSMLAAEPEVHAHFPVSEPLPHAWIMRAEDQRLQAAVDEFIDETYRGRDYNVLHARYFEHPARFLPLKTSDQELLALGGELSPYDVTVRENADRFGFDWRLIVAQMYQESRFNPDAESSAGAIGLMQMLPSTASELGVSELSKPESAIRAGVQYLSNLYGLFENELAFEDRTWFALAAYNAGLKRVKQAREKAAAMGLDPDRWFGNVEKAMLTLADDGGCHCAQPVAYVREIRARYHNYVRLTHAVQYAASAHNRVSHDT